MDMLHLLLAPLSAIGVLAGAERHLNSCVRALGPCREHAVLFALGIFTIWRTTLLSTPHRRRRGIPLPKPHARAANAAACPKTGDSSLGTPTLVT